MARKRGNREGGIYQVGPTKWQLAAHRNGKRHWRTVDGTRRDAERALHRLLDELDQIGGAEGTLGELIRRRIEIGDLAALTAEDYGRILRRLPAAYTAMEIDRVTPAWIKRMFVALEKTYEWSPHRIDRLHSVLGSSLQLAVEGGEVQVNAARQVRRQSIPKPELIIPDADHVRAAFEAADGWLRVWLRLAATTGARRGELCALRWDAIDFERRQLVVMRSAYSLSKAEAKRQGRSIEAGVRQKGTKTETQRTVALDGKTVVMLGEWREEQAREAKRNGLPAPKYVLTNPAKPDGPRRPDGLTQAWARFLRRKGIGHIELRTVRHYAGTSMLTNGIDVRTAAGRLGNDPKVLLTRYAGFMEAADRGAADVLGNLL